MQVGVCLPHYGLAMETGGVERFVRRVEALGFDSLWVTDHVIVPKAFSGAYKDRMLDPLATLNYLAGITSRVRLGTSVIILPYRNPITVAKEVATADVLSGGRVIFGAASGWMEGEFKALGVDFASRGAVADEYLSVIRAVWTNPEGAFESAHFALQDVVFSPRPVQRPRPPIWIGGLSKRAARRAVEFGDAWHPTRLAVGDCADALSYLARLAARQGRATPPALTVRCVVSFGRKPTEGRADHLAGTSHEVADALRKYAAAGVQHAVIGFPDIPLGDQLAHLEQLAAEVKPQLM